MHSKMHSEVEYQRGDVDGGAKRDRTADLLRARQALSQLSYSPIDFANIRVTEVILYQARHVFATYTEVYDPET